MELGSGDPDRAGCLDAERWHDRHGEAGDQDRQECPTEAEAGSSSHRKLLLDTLASQFPESVV